MKITIITRTAAGVLTAFGLTQSALAYAINDVEQNLPSAALLEAAMDTGAPQFIEDTIISHIEYRLSAPERSISAYSDTGLRVDDLFAAEIERSDTGYRGYHFLR